MTTLEERVPRLEGIIEQINERLRVLDQGQESLRAEIRSLREGLESLGTEFRSVYGLMESNFRWTVGVILVTWITVIGTVLGVLLAR